MESSTVESSARSVPSSPRSFASSFTQVSPVGPITVAIVSKTGEVTRTRTMAPPSA